MKMLEPALHSAACIKKIEAPILTKNDVPYEASLIFNAGVAVLDGVVLTVSFKFARMKVAISANSKGTLVIAFTYSDGAKVEV